MAMKPHACRLALLAVLVVFSCNTTGGPSQDYLERHDRGVDLFKLKQFEESKRTFEALLADYPDGHLNNGVRLRVASCDFLLGNVEEARRVYREIIDSVTDPSLKVLAIQSLGDLELHVGQYERAAGYFEQAMELEPDPAKRRRIEYRHGLSLQQAGRFADARDVFRGIAAVAPGTSEAADAEARLQLPDFFTVQIGAYGRRAGADALASVYRQRGFAVQVEPVQRGDATLYRVWIGRYDSRRQAEQMRARLLESGIVEDGVRPMVVP